MSNDHQRNDGESADRRLIREAKEEAWHTRRALRRELPTPSAEVKHDLACALDDYRDLLLDYKDGDALDTPWDEREVDVDVLDRLLTETTTRVQHLNRRGSPRKETTVQRVADADPKLLFDIAKELDAIALELGFAAKPDESTHRSEITDELIEEVEKWRKRKLEA